MVSIRPEARLLLCCARSHMDPWTVARIRTLLQEDIDWAHLLRTARSHGMVPLLYRHLNATVPELIPKATLDQLRDQFHTNAHRNLFMTGELLDLLSRLEAHGIHAIPYKGPVLAVSVYGNLALREFCDLDILVRRRDISRAKELLISHGYRPVFHLTEAQETANFRSQYEHVFQRENDKVIVALHWDITPPYFHFPLNFEKLWERLRPISLAGTIVPSLSPEDLLLILCVHGTKHGWDRLELICCIAELLRAYENIDWLQLMEQANALDSTRMLLLGLILAHDLLGVTLPAEVLRLSKADRTVGSLKGLVRERLFLEGDKSPGLLNIENALFQLRATERPHNKVRYCLGLAMICTVRDWTVVQLPSPLSFLYLPLRAVRLAKKYGPVLLKRLLRRRVHRASVAS